MLGPQGQFINNLTDVPIIEVLALTSGIYDTAIIVSIIILFYNTLFLVLKFTRCGNSQTCY